MAKRKADTTTTASASKRQRRSKNVASKSSDTGTTTQPSTTAHSPAPTSFFSLPRELRDQIYHEIWRTKAGFELALPELRGHHSGGFDKQIVQVRYAKAMVVHRARNPQNKGRVWFLASKQLCAEAIQQFQRGAAWSFIGPGPCCIHRSPANWTAPYTRRANASLSPYMLTPSGATDVSINRPANMKTYAELDGRNKFVKRVEIYDTRVLKQLVPSLAGSSGLKTLTLNINVETRWPADEQSAIEIDFKFLEDFDLPNLQLLRFSILYEDNSFKGDERLMEEFEKALSRVGMGLVGGDGIEENEIWRSVGGGQERSQVSFTRK